MGRSLKNRNIVWISGKAHTLSEFLWNYIAPGFLVKLRDKVRVWRLKGYKLRKVREFKMLHDAHYYMEFNIIVNDGANPKNFGPFNTCIPAKAVFFAKRKLARHIKNCVDVDVTYFDKGDDTHVLEGETSFFDVHIFDDIGKRIETMNNVEAISPRDAYLKVNHIVKEHASWDAIKHN